MLVQTASLSGEAASVVQALTDTATRTVAHVPSSAIAPMILDLLDRAGQEGVPELIPTGREEEAIGVVGAMNLVGHRSVVLMQDNGFGNALTAISTWAGAYHLPLPIFANSRGGLGEYNSMIHAISGSVDELLSALGVPLFKLDFRDSPTAWHQVSVEAIKHSWMTRRPVVVLMNFWKGDAEDR
jgi:sulfopyruvate decarboxylase subunit alpha